MTYSKHALERFAERIMDKDEIMDINTYILLHREQIEERLAKMVEYSELIFTGKSNHEFNKNEVDVYLNKDGWTIIVDHKNQNVITVFHIDLGLGKEFNQEYISKLLDKFNTAKLNLESKLQEINKDKEMYSKLISDNQAEIEEYRMLIKSLEQQNNTYQEVIRNFDVNNVKAEKEVREILGVLIGKKVF